MRLLRSYVLIGDFTDETESAHSHSIDWYAMCEGSF